MRWSVVAVLATVAWAVAAWLAGGGAPARSAVVSWGLGLALGIALQRGRFCFFCIFRDLFERRLVGGAFAVLMALAVGSVGYAIVFSVWVPDPSAGRLPPDAHVGPVSWLLAVAGLVFGVGMTLAGGCVSALLYRIGEGYARAPFGLLGVLVGFGLGFLTWRPLYWLAIADAPVVWLPARFGHAGALALQLALLAGLGAALLALRPVAEARPATAWTVRQVLRAVLRDRWSPAATGAIVGALAVIAYFLVAPLGVTAQLGSLARTAMDGAGWLGDRLPGLDVLAGCATVVATVVLDNGWLILGLVVGAAAAAFAADRFRPTELSVANATTAAFGGVLMGWASMIALGCTVGVLLSGTMAGSGSGWTFLTTCLLGTWGALKLGWGRG